MSRRDQNPWISTYSVPIDLKFQFKFTNATRIRKRCHYSVERSTRSCTALNTQYASVRVQMAVTPVTVNCRLRLIRAVARTKAGTQRMLNALLTRQQLSPLQFGCHCWELFLVGHWACRAESTRKAEERESPWQLGHLGSCRFWLEHTNSSTKRDVLTRLSSKLRQSKFDGTGKNSYCVSRQRRVCERCRCHQEEEPREDVAEAMAMVNLYGHRLLVQRKNRIN
jgi:hypothetical protein